MFSSLNYFRYIPSPLHVHVLSFFYSCFKASSKSIFQICSMHSWTISQICWSVNAKLISQHLSILHKNSTRPSKNARSLGWNILFHSEKIPMPDQMPGFSYQKLLIPFSRHQFFQDSVTSLHIVQRCMNHICIFLRLLRIRKFITIIIPGINDIQKIILVKPCLLYTSDAADEL